MGILVSLPGGGCAKRSGGDVLAEAGWVFGVVAGRDAHQRSGRRCVSGSNGGGFGASRVLETRDGATRVVTTMVAVALDRAVEGSAERGS